MPGGRALDVGSGSGYLTACMAQMVSLSFISSTCILTLFLIQVGDTGCVIGIEHIKELNDQAIANVEKGNGNLLKEDRLKLLGQ